MIVTHNMEIANMTQRVIALKDGLVEKEEYIQRLDSYRAA